MFQYCCPITLSNVDETPNAVARPGDAEIANDCVANGPTCNTYCLEFLITCSMIIFSRTTPVAMAIFAAAAAASCCVA